MVSHTKGYPISLIVIWIFRHLGPSPLSRDLPRTAAPAEPVALPSTKKTLSVAEFESHSPLPYVAATSIGLVTNSSGFMTVYLDFLEFCLRRIWGLASWMPTIDARACH